MSSNEVPDGTIAEVLDWVGDSADRARAAIAAEESGAQRSTLLAKLEAIASQSQEAEVSETQYPEQPQEGAEQPQDECEPTQETQRDEQPPQDAETQYDAPTTGTQTTQADETATQDAGGSVAPEQDDVEASDEPEQPTTIVLDTNDEGTVIGPVHVRDADVEVVAEEVDMAITSEDEIGGEQVEYLQVAGATNGVVLALNGTPYSLTSQMAASLKTAFDKAVAGLSL